MDSIRGQLPVHYGQMYSIYFRGCQYDHPRSFLKSSYIGRMFWHGSCAYGTLVNDPTGESRRSSSSPRRKSNANANENVNTIHLRWIAVIHQLTRGIGLNTQVDYYKAKLTQEPVKKSEIETVLIWARSWDMRDNWWKCAFNHDLCQSPVSMKKSHVLEIWDR